VQLFLLYEEFLLFAQLQFYYDFLLHPYLLINAQSLDVSHLIFEGLPPNVQLFPSKVLLA
jgi:hypothetical protein